MILYLSVTEGLASWLLGKPALLGAFADAIQHRRFEDLEAEHLYAAGPIRLAYDRGRGLVSAWNADLLSGTGIEEWALFNVQSNGGLLGYPAVLREAFERSAYVASQRLRGYVLDGGVMHKALHNGVHTCLAGRGSSARQLSLGYYESDLTVRGSRAHSMVVSGPFDDYAVAAQLTRRDSERLSLFVEAATALVNHPRLRRAALPSPLSGFRQRLELHGSSADNAPRITVSTRTSTPTDAVPGAIYTYSYDDWLRQGSSLTDVQRSLIDRFPLDQHPLRILGPAGSGKTLLMQLLALRAVERPSKLNRATRVLYIAHNAAMAETVRQRFAILAEPERLRPMLECISVKTLSEFGKDFLRDDEAVLLDRDAHEAKQLQLEILQDAFKARVLSDEKAGGPFCSLYRQEAPLRGLILGLVAAEISAAIKGNGIGNDRKRYVESDRSLSRLHGVLKSHDREMVFDIYKHYQSEIEQRFRVLDADDLALTLLSRLKSPLWALQREKRGYDYLFVDETQLFNENERRIFALLAARSDRHVPLALALDDAQDLYGYNFTAVATLGLGDIQTATLPSVQRSTPEIIRLAMFVISQTNDLFGVDFPEFEHPEVGSEQAGHQLAEVPRLSFAKTDNAGEHVVQLVEKWRQQQLRSIAVVVHADRYVAPVADALSSANLPLQVLKSKGESIETDHPIVAFGTPETIAGQEFDGVIVVGLEEGVSPPLVSTNEPLAAAVEQQALRETYLSVSRARFRVAVVITKGHEPNRTLVAARQASLIHPA